MAGSPTITEQGFQYTWRIKITDNQLDTKAIEHYVQNKNARKVAFLAENSDYGKPPTKAAADRARNWAPKSWPTRNTTAARPTSKAQLTNIRDRAPTCCSARLHGGANSACPIPDSWVNKALRGNAGGGGPPSAQGLAGCG